MQNLFKKLMGSYPTGINIVTLSYQNQDYGFTCNSLNAISLNPPIIAFTVRLASHLFDFFFEGEHFGVSILTDRQESVAKVFSSHESMENRLSVVPTIRAKNDCLIIKNCLASIECIKESQHIKGDHLVIYALVRDGCFVSEKPLVYFRRQYTGILSKIDCINEQHDKVV